MPGAIGPTRNVAGAHVAPSIRGRRVAAVISFALLTALSARMALPLPGTDVPVTLQTLIVMLSGALLGPYLGAAAQLMYLLAGALGLPVFAMGAGLAYLFGPTGGYLLAFPLAAALTGLLSGQKHAPGFLRAALAMIIASVLILMVGWAQLTLLRGNASAAFQMGVLPFLVGDILKVTLGALIATRLRPRTLGLM